MNIEHRCNAKCFTTSSRCVTFYGAAEDVSPACIVYGPSTCPGETYQPGHSIWPFLETVDHLFHLNRRAMIQESFTSAGPVVYAPTSV